MKSLRYLCHLFYRTIKLRNKEALWKLHKDFYETKKPVSKKIIDNQPIAISKTHSLTLRPLDKIENNAIVLDAGCNNGTVGKHLIEKGCFVYGVDVNPDLIEQAKIKGIFASVCPVERLTFADNFFDHCLAFEILEHLYNPEDGLRELYRVLKVGGILFGSVPYPFGKFSKSSKYQWIWHQHDFNKKSLKNLLKIFFEPKKISIRQRLVYENDDSYKLFFEAIK